MVVVGGVTVLVGNGGGEGCLLCGVGGIVRKLAISLLNDKSRKK